MPKTKVERRLELMEGGLVANTLKLERVAEIAPLSSGKEFIYIEKGDDGWRLTYTKNTIPNISGLTSIVMERTG